MPAYIGQTQREGSGVFDPVRAINGNHVFYSVSNRLVPAVDELEQLLSIHSIDVLLVVHYFGFVHLEMQRIREICDRKNVILVEDCAHVGFVSNGSVGSVGDFSFYSLHKFFAVESGGVLRRNQTRIGVPTIEDGHFCSPDVMEQMMCSDVLEIVRRRRENYSFLERALASVEGIERLWKLGRDTVPHNFPVIVKNELREELYFHLLERNMPTMALYYQLVDELDPCEFPVSFDIANSILNLPVHQDTAIDDLVSLVAELEAFFER